MTNQEKCNGRTVKTAMSALLGLIILTASLAATAQFTYTTNNGSITIIGYTGPGGAVTIPDSINGLPVTTIGGSAFDHESSLTSVTIPSSVTNIALPVSYVCSSLMAITVDSANAYYGSVDGVLFNKSQNILLECPDGKTGSYAIPGGVTNIGNYAFEYCCNLTSVTIPGTVSSIAAGTFYSCTNLISFTIPDSVTSIGYGAFAYCFSLTGVTIPGSVTNIGANAFSGCSLTNVAIPSSVTSIGYSPFIYCDSLMAITVDPANAAYSSLDGVLFNKSKTTLIECPGGKAGTYAIPGSVTSIGDDAFYQCLGLSGVTIPVAATSIGNGAFQYCLSLTRVTILGGVTNIGHYAFFYCTALTEVFFKGNASLVGSSAFDYTVATLYYLPGTTGWGPTLAGELTRLWNPLMQTGGAGPAAFGFNITGTADIPIVIEAATSLADAAWVPLQSLNLTNGAFYFSDPNWEYYRARFYRIRSP